jgi:hypothetical protein
MIDPHVQAVYYQVRSEEGIIYDDPIQISFMNDLGKFDLSNSMLCIMPAKHFASEDDAKKELEPFLNDWVIGSDLTSNIGAIRFKFEHTDIIDLYPPLPGTSQNINLNVAEVVAIGESISVQVPRNEYPKPPEGFHATPTVMIAYDRWFEYKKGKGRLLDMAYFVLTLLESEAGYRKSAAIKFQIDKKILYKIGELSSRKGDEKTARKVDKKNPFQGLHNSEILWLEEAIKKIIYRLGEVESGNPLVNITMDDLPPLRLHS